MFLFGFVLGFVAALGGLYLSSKNSKRVRAFVSEHLLEQDDS